MLNYDRFTERAQDAAQRALEVLQRYGHSQVDAEHFFLAMLEQPEGIVPQLLERMNVDVAVVSGKLDDVLKQGSRSSVYGSGQAQIFITPRLRRIAEIASEEANRLKDEFISTEHLLLAMTSERNTPSARILADYKITKDRVMDNG